MKTRDLHVESIRPLLPPAILLEELPLSEKGSLVVGRTRKEVTRVLRGEDDRLLVIVGPCSIHDPVAGLDYARRLKKLADELGHDLRIVMRVYFEKPRTTVGWKGLINDPHLDGSFAINEGLRLARRLLLDLVELGLPSGCEFLDPITPQFTSDLVAWGAIGADGPNYDAIHVQKALAALRDAKLPARLMVDTSHGNSDKDHKRQPVVARDVASQIAQ